VNDESCRILSSLTLKPLENTLETLREYDDPETLNAPPRNVAKSPAGQGCFHKRGGGGDGGGGEADGR
jgi:hypothetical protein